MKKRFINISQLADWLEDQRFSGIRKRQLLVEAINHYNNYGNYTIILTSIDMVSLCNPAVPVST